MKISVIIPVYNVEKYLRQCLDSFINQTMSDIEIICVDDGSTDNSLEILKEYPQIKIVTQKNQGAGTARNRGLEIATGEYIYFFDSDDYAKPTLCEDVYKIAVENDKPDIIKFKCECFDDKTGEKIYDLPSSLSSFCKNLVNKSFQFKDYPDETLTISVVPWNGVCRREFLIKNNIRFNNLKCVNDISFFINTIIKADSIFVSDKSFVYHRANVSTSLMGVRDKNFQCEIESYYILDKMTQDIDFKLRYKILEFMFLDIYYWYFKFIKNSPYNKEIHKIMKEFLKDIGIKTFGKGRRYYVLFVLRYGNLLMCKIVSILWKISNFLYKIKL